MLDTLNLNLDDLSYCHEILNKHTRLRDIIHRLMAESRKTAFTSLRDQIFDAVDALDHLPKDYKDLLVKECISAVIDGEDEATVMAFLDKCATSSRIIDLPAIVSTAGSGKLPIPVKYHQLCKRLARLVPGSSNAAAGKGELLLLTIGRNAKNAFPGDIVVEGKQQEIKASDITKSGISDFVLGKMDTKSSRTILVTSINKFFGKTVFLDKEAKHKSNGVTGLSGISSTNIGLLNQYFKQMGNTAVSDIFAKMLEAAVGPGFDRQIVKVVKAISKDGTIDFSKMIPLMKELVFDFYQAKNGHHGVILLNIEKLEYTMTLTKKDFVNAPEILVTKLFDFRPVASSILSIKRV